MTISVERDGTFLDVPADDEGRSPKRSATSPAGSIAALARV
jgi:hypothetical protein